MATKSGTSILDQPFFASRIKSMNVQRSEKWLGYFVGPAIVYCMFYMCGQTYLNQFYTDVLKMTSIGGGLFLTLLPIISKIVDAITNILMGRLVDRTKTKQGKARPWILLSGVFLAVAGILLFTVPTANQTVQVIWVTVSYNLYFCMAFTMYNISHMLMVPLSTRNSRQRDLLGMFTSMGTSMIPGVIVTMLFPLLILPIVGVDQGKWITVMSIISILALPAVMLEYYFTRERVTEENIEETKGDQHSFADQVKGCLNSKYWIVIMGIVIVYNIYNNFQVTSLLYYVKWVLGTPESYENIYALLNAVGQAPLGFGVFLMWPLLKKFGKTNCMIFGSVFSIVGNVVCTIFAHDLTLVMVGLFLRSFGSLPITYTLISMIADSLDHVEWLNNFRCDGFSSSVYSIILTVTVGISTGIFNLCLSMNGYDAALTSQGAAAQRFLTVGAFVVPAVGAFLIGFLCSFYKIDKEIVGIQRDLVDRKKAECAALGIEYVSPEEQAAREQAELERVAEENRIKELRAKCAKKGLNFEAEETKYQQKLAEQKAKAERKAARKK